MQYTRRQETWIVNVGNSISFSYKWKFCHLNSRTGQRFLGCFPRSFLCLKAAVPYASIWIRTAQFYRLALIIVRTAHTIRKIYCVARYAIEFDYLAVIDVPQGCAGRDIVSLPQHQYSNWFQLLCFEGRKLWLHVRVTFGTKQHVTWPLSCLCSQWGTRGLGFPLAWLFVSWFQLLCSWNGLWPKLTLWRPPRATYTIRRQGQGR